MEARGLVHKDMTAEEGYSRLAKAVEWITKQEQTIHSKLFGLNAEFDRTKRDGLVERLGFFSDATAKQKIWLIRESCSMPNALAIDFTRISRREHTRKSQSSRLALTIVGWRVLGSEENINDGEGRLKEGYLKFNAEAHEESLLTFLAEHKFYRNLLLYPIVQSKEDNTPPTYVKIEL